MLLGPARTAELIYVIMSRQMRKGPCCHLRGSRKNLEFLQHVAVLDDEPSDEKIVGCMTCETIITLPEEHRLTEVL